MVLRYDDALGCGPDNKRTKENRKTIKTKENLKTKCKKNKKK